MTPHRIDAVRTSVAMGAPLVVVGMSLALGLPWWLAVAPLVIVAVAVAEVAGRLAGAVAALCGGLGLALLVGRSSHPLHPHNGLELAALAALSLVAAVVGASRTTG